MSDFKANALFGRAFSLTDTDTPKRPSPALCPGDEGQDQEEQTYSSRVGKYSLGRKCVGCGLFPTPFHRRCMPEEMAVSFRRALSVTI